MMNEFTHNYLHRSTETEKKGRKVKHHREESCKCVSPFVKLHYHDCPLVMKPCPVHGNYVQHNEREARVEREENVIISFHPSSKTERLLQPIKSFLTNCNSGTKINFQYYPSDTCLSKENLKSQNAYENLKKSINGNVFVEKTKSFVANKTNKVKKLKQCFHSPCNSIAQRTRSQTSIKEKVNQILREEAKQTRNFYYHTVPEVPPDEKRYSQTSKWFFSNRGEFNPQDLLSDEKLDSDFITVTQHDRNNAIHHKVFEIKHRKGLNDIPFVGFPSQPPQFVYPSMNVPAERNQTAEFTYEKTSEHRQLSYASDREAKDETDGMGKNIEVSSSEKTHRSFTSSSSSSGSVYITPFFLVPRGARMDEGDTGAKPKEKPPVKFLDEAVQVEVLKSEKEEGWPKETQTSATSSERVLLSVSPKPTPREKPGYKSVLLQTESYLYETLRSSSGQIFVHEYESYSKSRIAATHGGSDLYRRHVDDGRHYKASETSKRLVDSGSNTRSVEVQMITDSTSTTRSTTKGGVTGNTYDKESQTENPFVARDSLKTLASDSTSRSRYDYKGRGRQIRSKETTAEDSEFIHLNSPNVTYVIKPFDQKESDQAIEKLAKTWWGKSHSDSDLYERLRCECYKGDNENNLQAGPSKRSTTPDRKGTRSKVYESGAACSRVNTSSKTGNVTLRTKETVEQFSNKKHMSTREEEISAAVSDLSELKKIIQDFFEKGSILPKKPCDCEAMSKGKKADIDTMTDTENEQGAPQPAPKSNRFSRPIQTPLRFLTDIIQNPLSMPVERKPPKTNTATQFSLEKVGKNDVQQQTSEMSMKHSAYVHASNLEDVEKSTAQVQPSEIRKIKEKNSLPAEIKKNNAQVQTLEIMGEMPEKKSAQIQVSVPPEVPEKKSAQLQVSQTLKHNVYSETSTSVSPPEKQTASAEPSLDKQGTSTKSDSPQVDTATGTEKGTEKRSTETQTNFSVLLDEAGGEVDGRDKVKVRQTVVVDPETLTKTFFLCSLCGREIKSSVNTATNTDSSQQQSPERKEKPIPTTTVSDSQQGKIHPKDSQEQKRSLANPVQKSERPGGRSDTPTEKRHQTPKTEYSPRVDSSQKSKIPLPSTATYVRLKKKETVVQEERQYIGPHWVRQKSVSSQLNLAPKQCLCDSYPGPSTSGGQKSYNEPKSKGTTSQTKQHSSSPRREQDGHQSRKSGSQSAANRSDKANIFPVIVTSFWPADFIQTMKLMENANSQDNPSGECPISKQKRSYEKDLETTAAGKKIKMEAIEGKEKHIQFGNHLIDLLRQGDFQIWPSEMMTCDQLENEVSSIATDDLNENMPFPDKEACPEQIDILSESERSCNTARTTESSSMGRGRGEVPEEEEEDEILEEEEEEEELGEGRFEILPKLKQHSQSAISFGKSLSGATTTSKSLNAFWFFMEPHKNNRNEKREVLKKRKTQRRKKQKRKKKVLTE